MPTFTPEDLSLGTDVLDQLTSACANQSINDPIGSSITLGVSKVNLYAAGYALTDDDYKRLVRALAVYELFRLAGGGVPSEHDKANADAMKELIDIRDGKFPALAKSGESAGSVSGSGSKWGSGQRLRMPLDSATGQ